MPPKTPVTIRKIGGPPRSTPKPSPSTASTSVNKGKAPIRPNQVNNGEGSGTDTEDLPDGEGSGAAEEAAGGNDGGRRVKLRPDPSYISQLEMQDDQEDSDEGGWDEVGITTTAETAANDFSSPGPSRQRNNLTDDETTGGARTATATEDENENDGTAEEQEEEVDLEAVYGYDFRAELDGGDAGRGESSAQGQGKGKGRAGVEISLGPMDGLTEEQRQRAEELANRK